MCLICDGGDLSQLTTLRCFNCPLLTTIPLLPNLTALICVNCPMLTTTPLLPNLTYLSCYECPLLTTIPLLPNLTYLSCYMCPMFTTIPLLPNLTRLHCIKCPWLLNDDKYDNSISNLLILQRWFKKLLFAKGLIRRSIQITPYWYDPNAHGGFFHKKHMLEYFTE
jgi:hypothetical protein